MAFRSFRATLEVIYGWGSMEYLAELKAARAFIVADETMKKLGYLGRAKRLLRRARVQVAQFTGVTPEPDIKCVGRGVALCRKFKPRVIIGLGGGSVLDATKAIRIFYEHPRLRFEEIHCSLGPPKRSIPPFRKTVQISIPATSGTGSDVSASSMVTDSGLKLKCLIFDPNLFPETVILDYELPLSMPPALTAHTGIDALTHTVESLASRGRNDISEALGLRAASLIMNYLPRAFKDGSDRKAREKMHLAATMAGRAMANTGLGICHSMANQLGPRFGFSHGFSNGLLLPYVMRFNLPASSDTYAAVAEAVGLSGRTRLARAMAFIEAVERLNRTIKLPSSIRRAGVRARDFQEQLEGMSRYAVLFPATSTNPRAVGAGDLRRILEAAYEGRALHLHRI